jgi:adenosine kinase
MIIVTGTLAYDYIMEFPGAFGDHILPEQTHNINLSFIVNKFAKHRGGTGGNVSYTMGLLKAPHILLSIAGSDFDEYKKAFEKIGINTSNIVVVDDESTATGFAMTDRASNQIWGYYYGASARTGALKIKSVTKYGDLIIVGPQGAKGSMSIIKQCIAQDISYMFDPGFILTEVEDNDLKLGVTHADYIIGNEYEIEVIRKRILNFDKLTKEKTVIRTLGSKGAEIKSKKEKINIKSVKAKKIASTTGAGDAWRGGFLSGLARNLDLETSGKIGATAASFAVEHFGAQEQTYSIKEFTARYRHTYNSLLKL